MKISNALKTLGFKSLAARDQFDTDNTDESYDAYHTARREFVEAAEKEGVELPEGCGEDIHSILEG